MVSSTWYQVLGTKYVVPSRWYQIPRFVNSVHEPFTNRSQTSVHEQAFTNNSNTFTIAVHEQGAHSRSRTVHEQPFTNKPFTNIRTPLKLPLVLVSRPMCLVLARDRDLLTRNIATVPGNAAIKCMYVGQLTKYYEVICSNLRKNNCTTLLDCSQGLV